jgi:two-component sensor histidine kinase
VSFLYDSDFKSAKTLRDFIETICDILELENKWKSRLILITDELNNNAIEYGSLAGDKNTMTISIQKVESTYEISAEIEDTGK